MAQSAKQNCEICMSARGSEYCLDCCQYFCNGCKSSHLRIAVCKNHTFKDSSSAYSDSLIFCQEHKEAYAFICEPCGLPVCRHCTVKTHKGHAMADIHETVSKKRTDFQTSIRSVLNTGNIQQIENIEQQIGDYSNQINAEVTSAIEDVKLDGERLKKSVDGVVRQIIDHVQEKSKQEKDTLARSMKETNELKSLRDSLRAKEVEIGSRRVDISLLAEISNLEGSIEKISVPSVIKPPSIKYKVTELTDEAIRSLLGQIEFQNGDSFADVDCVLSGKVFEDILSHGTTFRNAISMFDAEVKIEGNVKAEMILIPFYRIQMMNEFSSHFVQKIVRIFVDTNESWKTFVFNSIDQLNTAAPGLLLQLTDHLGQADIVICDKTDSSDIAWISWQKVSDRYIAVIEVYAAVHPSRANRQAVVTFEILCALGFQRAILRLYSTLASVPFSFENDRNVVDKVDPFSITLTGKNKLFKHNLGRNVWKLHLEDQTNLHELSELDKVILNLLFPPCFTKDYQPKLSVTTSMFYCGRRVMQNHNHPNKSRTDGRCGPTNGANCPSCRTLVDKKRQKMAAVLAKGKFQGWSGQIYCGKKCGPDCGTPCRTCHSEIA